MFTTYFIPIGERAVLLRDGLPLRALPPGKHRVFGGGHSLVRLNVAPILVSVPAEIRAALPAEWLRELTLGARERALVLRDGRPVLFLRPGVHRLFTVDPTVEVRVLSLDAPVPEMTDELRAIVPTGEVVEVLVLQYQRGLLYVNGRFERLLDAGRHAFWSPPGARVTVTTLDTRVQQLVIQGQELMTRDKVTLRLTLVAEHAPADAVVATHTVVDAKDSVYLLVQLAAREHVASVTLDELLEGRDAMTKRLEEVVVPQARAIGVAVHRVGVKDVVLPGEMKTLLNRVIEAEKDAAAHVILRREEAAAMRNMANTARVIADNPVLMRLKELETLEKVAAQIDEIRLVVGADGLAGALAGPLLASKSG
jgi:regulator of protease activity HflC (stomatin/prohibitin superfamily)